MNQDKVSQLIHALRDIQRAEDFKLVIGNDELPFWWDFATLYEADGETTYNDEKDDYDFHRCGTVGCALGLAIHLGLTRYGPEVARSAQFVFDEAGADLGFTEFETSELFGCTATSSTYGVDDEEDVTPGMIADELERRVIAEFGSMSVIQPKPWDVVK